MGKRTTKRAGSARTTRRAAPPTPTQPMLPTIVAGALEMGSHAGRAALRTARDILGAAARLAASSGPKMARPSAPRDSRLPEAELNAIAGARRRERNQLTARRIPASRKPLTRSPSRAEPSAVRRRRRNTA